MGKEVNVIKFRTLDGVETDFLLDEVITIVKDIDDRKRWLKVVIDELTRRGITDIPVDRRLLE